MLIDGGCKCHDSTTSKWVIISACTSAVSHSWIVDLMVSSKRGVIRLRMSHDYEQPALSAAWSISIHTLPAPSAGLTIHMNFCVPLAAHFSGKSMA